ncbi:MAG: hypothetical protein K6T81_09575 [Alicyclobacillus macrosporangiidus]|uniref:hypothetical protein n=1 Tax=Alicyclobacillus macrosporangiidus TaxID=392015 RepID=UPI0026EF21B5|nr:hypothetical protein [Alicyclobacillus macrosporangiidus]MCL6598980.1 hypothetical protein [Alicyclobacillus macrosporangiidus]
MSLTKEERKALYQLFANYRAAKEAISTRRAPTKRGFASAVHPDLIKPSRVYPSLPKVLTGMQVSPGFTEASFRRFIWRIDWYVRQLRPYRRAIIRRRYLYTGARPKDRDVYEALRRDGWYVSWRHYEREKEEGLEELFLALKSRSGAENRV